MDKNQSQSAKKYLTPFSILLAAALIAGALIYSSGAKSVRKPNADLTAQVKPAADFQDLADDDVILGDPNAKVTIVEFGDYQCPFCKKFFDEIEPRLREEYIKTGEVRMVYRDFPLESIHPYARSAAEASQCAAEQNKFWAYHDLLLGRQSEIPNADFAKWAGDLGLNAGKFRECYQNQRYAGEVSQDFNDGMKLGVRGTPATFINGKLISGAQPYEVFKVAIDTELQKQ